MNNFIPTYRQFKKLQKLFKHLANLDLTDSPIPEWLDDIDKIYYNKQNGEWESFIYWVTFNDYDWVENFKEANKLWKKYKGWGRDK